MHPSRTRRRQRRRAGLAAGLSVPLVVGVLPGTALAAQARSQVTSDRPAYSTSGTPSSALADDAPVDFRVDLALRDRAGLDQLVRAVSTPGSPSYQAYLTPGQYTARFAPTQADVARVSSFLKDQGLMVGAVSPTRTSLSVTGTAAAAKAAFAATLRTYSTPTSGGLIAPDRALTLPSSVAPLVAGVRGLAQSPHLATPSRDKGDGDTSRKDRTDPAKVRQTVRKNGGAPPSPGFLNAAPCSTYYGEKTATGTPAVNGTVEPYAPCGYTPQQVQSAYGIDKVLNGRSPIDGRGTTVAITDAYNSPTVFTDAQAYSSQHGLPALTNGQYTTVLPRKSFRYGYNDAANGDQCGEQGWYGEQALDVEAVHAVAPGAAIVFVAARSCDNLDFADALATVVDNHLADAVSNSWGSTGEIDEVGTLQRYTQIFAQAAIEGIGFYFSSGDAGDNTDAQTPVPTVDLPASNPLVTAVGGTSLGVSRTGQWTFEEGWGTGKSPLVGGAWTPTVPGPFTSGGGGGASLLFAQPWYQKGKVPAALANKAGLGQPTRVLPDVSMDGDPNTGFKVGQTQTFLDGVRYSEYRIGGTSLSSPLMAGLSALSDQASGFHHGFLNPALYALRSTYLHDPSTDAVTHFVVRNDYPFDDATGASDPNGPLTTSLRALNLTKSLHAAPGYDDITGVGTPRGLGFLTHLGSP